MAGVQHLLMVARVRSGRLEPAEIVTASTEVLAAEQGEAASLLFAALRDYPAGDVAANVLEILQELAHRSASWARVVEKSLEKRGRCPPPLRAQLKRLLAEDRATPVGPKESLGDVITSDVFSEFEVERASGAVSPSETAPFERSRSMLGRFRGRVPVSRELTDINGMGRLAAVLAALEDCDEITLDFQGVEHVYVSGLTAIKAWSETHGVKVLCVNTSPETDAYLDVVGFSGYKPARSHLRSPDFLTPGLENVLKSEAQDVADRLVTLIEHHCPLGAETRSGLLIMFAELVENIHRHAGESTTAAFACAQVYPKRKKLTVCIVDTGMGLAQSIASGSNRELASRLQRGESALALAKAPLLTSKPDRHSGYGLYVATELILRNGGTFRLISGNESLTLYRKNWRRHESFAPVDRGWQGTWITMIIDLESVLPIKDVYLTLPSLEDSEKEDFFG
ncbi:MAG: hypothetical protein EBS90_11060 [Betaproteobacteria bacterium]|nr:hypothetical protein [Betaproteobacteria bacterium]